MNPKDSGKIIKTDAFDQLLQAWLPLTYAINSLNRSMGLQDWYPFTPSDLAISKLRFIHDIIQETTVLQQTDQSQVSQQVMR